MIKLLLLLIIGASTMHAASVEESAAVLAARFRGLPLREQTMANLPKGREQEVFAALVKDEAVYLEVLLRLNHEPTVNKVADEYLRMKGMVRGYVGVLNHCGSPYMIAKIAPALYADETPSIRWYGEGESDFGQSAQAAGIIGQLIIKAPEFPSEAKDWAKRNLGGPGPDVIQAGRAWWALNQAALLANKFDHVRQPESYPKAPTGPLSATPKPPSPAVPPSPAPAAAPSPAPVLDPAPTIPSPPPAAVASPPAKSSHTLWWILGAIAALAAGAFIARRQKSKG